MIQRLWSRGAIYLVLLAFCAFYLMPFYVMVITGLKPYEDVNVTRMWELPKGIYFGAFVEAWVKVAPNFWNSVVITGTDRLTANENDCGGRTHRMPGLDVVEPSHEPPLAPQPAPEVLVWRLLVPSSSRRWRL